MRAPALVNTLAPRGLASHGYVVAHLEDVWPRSPHGPGMGGAPMAAEPPAAELEQLQRILDESVASAGPALRANFVAPGWVMSAREFIDFWAGGRMAAVATVSARGRPRVAPLEVSWQAGRLHLPAFANSARLRDHRANPDCAITSWNDAWTAVIVNGQVELGEGATGMVSVSLVPTRIFAMRAPAGHHSRLRANS
jgi:Pyridoxamine 5'-phosphate oxidase